MKRWQLSTSIAELPLGSFMPGNTDIIALGDAMGRTSGSCWAMKCCNLASYDPALQARGIKGLSQASRLDAEIWSDFQEDSERIGYESELACARLTNSQPRQSDSVEWEDVEGLDKQVVTKVRVNQHLFVPSSWLATASSVPCAACQSLRAVVASHIVPWAADRSQRMNPHNGVCLCSLHDRAFDSGILAINSDFEVLIEPRMMKYGPFQKYCNTGIDSK